MASKKWVEFSEEEISDFDRKVEKGIEDGSVESMDADAYYQLCGYHFDTKYSGIIVYEDHGFYEIEYDKYDRIKCHPIKRELTDRYFEMEKEDRLFEMIKAGEIEWY